MSEKYTLTLPLPPNRANARGHWKKQHNAKIKYYKGCFVPIYQTFGTILNQARFQHIHLEARFYVFNEFDPDNIYGQLKWPLDALKHFNIIPDDRKQNVTFNSDDVTQQIDRKNPRLELTIWGSSTNTDRQRSSRTGHPARSAASPDNDETTPPSQDDEDSESTSEQPAGSLDAGGNTGDSAR